MTTQITTPQAPSGPSKVMRLDYNSEGHVTEIKETQIDHVALQSFDMPYEPFRALTEVKANGHTYKTRMIEAMLTNPDAANILRQDIRMVAFTALNAMQSSYTGFTDVIPSDKPEEQYLRDAAIGVLQPAPSGTEAHRSKTGFEGGTRIPNVLYRHIVEILGDWIRFDQIGKIRQVSAEMGLAGAMTNEATVYGSIRNTANYTRNSTTKDNDIGANTATATFNADTLRTALNTIATSKDRKSGAYLGYMADTIIIGVQLQVPVLQLLRSGQLVRTHGATTAEAIGTGQNNPLNGILRNIIVSPWFDNSFAWALCDSRRGAFKYQEVEPFNVFQQSQNVNNSESWLHLDILEYLIRGYFGVGFVDDRAWYLSDSTTDATVS